ncbi:MAG: beta strand repeat-containing protein, partial [Roseimicrobium sp.]
DDIFNVFSNKATLKLYGEDGNDYFVVRAFLLKGTNHIASGDTEVNGGEGDDLVEYNMNAPVGIDGGAGTNTLVVIGTEAADVFVITRDGVLGAGLNVSFKSVQKVQVDGMEGDDHFYVLSTHPDLVTTLVGGSGSDTFYIAADVTTPVIAASTEGRSSVINHNLFSDDPDFDGVFASGIPASVANGETGVVVVTPSNGGSMVGEPGSGVSPTDSYTLHMAAFAPAQATVVYLTVAAALASSKFLPNGGSVLVSTDGVNFYSELVLVFDSTKTGGDPNAWARTQTIYIKAVDDTVIEGEQTISITHSSSSSNAAFDRKDITPLDVRLIDNDKAGLIVTKPSDTFEIVEGGSGVVYKISLTSKPNTGETVTVVMGNADHKLTFAAALLAQAGRISGNSITFTEANWDQPFEVRVTALNDGDSRFAISRIIHTVSSSSGAGVYSNVVDEARITVEITDQATGGLIVTPVDASGNPDGVTTVTPTTPDYYTLQLTKAPTSDVTVVIRTDGNTIIGAFDPLDLRFATGVELGIALSTHMGAGPDDFLLSTNGTAASDLKFFTRDGSSFEVNLDGAVTLSDVIERMNSATGNGGKVSVSFDVETHLLAVLDHTSGGGIFSVENTAGSQAATKLKLAGVAEVAGAITSGQLNQNATVSTVTFSALNWNVPFMVKLTANPNAPAETGNQSVQTFAPQPHVTSKIQGPLLIEGDTMPGQDRSLTPGIKLPTEVDVPLPTLDITESGVVVDTVHVFNHGSQSADTGRLGSPVRVSGIAAEYGALTADIVARLNEFKNLSGLNMGNGLTLDYGVPGQPDQRTFDGGITFHNVEVTEISLGDKNDTFTVDGTAQRPGFRNITILNTGGGDDTVTVNIDDANNGDLAVNLGAGDDVFDGTASSHALMIFGGAGEDEIDGGTGDDAIFGDNGVIEYFNASGDLVTRLGIGVMERSTDPFSVLFVPAFQTDGGVNQARRFATRLATVGARDTIDGASGTDVIFGGAGKDKITANLGGKIIFGDHGEANLGGTNAGATNDVFSTEPGLGDDDEIIGGADGLGNIIIGGAGNDTISGGTGKDIILGDNGVVERNNASLVTRVYTIEPTIGGTDTIQGGSGFDIIMGGAKSDTINAPLGGKVILGDSGVANFLADPRLVGDVGDIYSTDYDLGDVDTITGGADGMGNIIIGGAGADIINGGTGDDIILGDNGYITRNAAGIVTSIKTLAPDVGGADVIDVGGGNNIVFGGAGSDVINVDKITHLPRGTADGNDVVLGDHGQADFDAVTGILLYITTTDPTKGAADYIFVGNGSNTVLGGGGADEITGGNNRDVIVGDHGNATFNAAGVLTKIITSDETIGGNDIIKTGNGDNTVLGGIGADNITGGA